MDDADLLRNRATRLFALATRSRQEGYSEYAEELDSLAREVVRHVVTIERRSGSAGPFDNQGSVSLALQPHNDCSATIPCKLRKLPWARLSWLINSSYAIMLL